MGRITKIRVQKTIKRRIDDFFWLGDRPTHRKHNKKGYTEVEISKIKRENRFYVWVLRNKNNAVVKQQFNDAVLNDSRIRENGNTIQILQKIWQNHKHKAIEYKFPGILSSATSRLLDLMQKIKPRGDIELQYIKDELFNIWFELHSLH